MSDTAELVAFKRKQIASLHDNGSDAAKAAIERLSADIARLDPASPEGVAAAAEAAKSAPAPASNPAHDARLAAAEKAHAELAARVESLAARLGVVEVLTAPQGA